jgi:hypothetical protein
VTVPAGGSVHINPPAGFTPTDLVIISQVLRGKDSGGFTVYDPPTATTSTLIRIPCAANNARVWGFQFFGATDYGPVFASAPMAMSGFDGAGFPRIETAKTDANGNPVVNTTGGHCFQGTGTIVLADPATRTVRPEFAPQTTGSFCTELRFTSNATATTVTEASGAKK